MLLLILKLSNQFFIVVHGKTCSDMACQLFVLISISVTGETQVSVSAEHS